MKKQNQCIKWFVLMSIFLCLLTIMLKYFNLTWVEVNEEGAKVTINFLLPMAQNQFTKAIYLKDSHGEMVDVSCKVAWINEHIATLSLQENGEIKGKKVQLFIDSAPTKFKRITKSEKVTLPFTTPIVLGNANTKQLISSTESFYVRFNTPIKAKYLSQYIESEAIFKILPYHYLSKDGRTVTDETCYVFTPQVPLENGKCYTIVFKAGLSAVSGALLQTDQRMYLQVDEKPEIIATYPNHQDKWIGLYPKIMITSKKPMVAALAKINGQMLEGTLMDQTHAYFLLDTLLAPSTTYEVQIQIKAPSGEQSRVETVSFTTTSINDHRPWLEIKCGKEKCLTYYQGEKQIKTFLCAIGKEIKATDYGTYYLQNKAEVYENNKAREGANYWMGINEKFGIHGYTRTSDWQVKSEILDEIGGRTTGKNIVLSDLDAQWLYEKLGNQTMIVIHE